jgi:small subunit ribosomal protein S6
MRKYEIMFVIRPDLPEDEVEKVVTQFEGVLTGAGGKMEKIERMGKRRMAYRVQRHREGIYVLFVCEGTGDTVKEVERRFKVTDSVIRYLTVRTDEELKRAEKRKAERAKQAARQGRPKTAAPAPSFEAAAAE